MSRRMFVSAVALATLLGFSIATEPRGQETAAQVEATSRAAREQAARDRVNLKTSITKPTTTGANPGERATADTRPQPEALKRRAGEQIGNDARGRAQILGMYVQESDNGGVKVVDVGAASPAFAAGIRRGDELVSFRGFQANSYRKWIDGIGRLATEAQPGDTIPVVVLRHGDDVATEIRAPESHTGLIQLPIGVPPQDALSPAGQQVDVVAMPGGENGVAINNIGPFASFFSPDSTPATERAMAELFRVNRAADPESVNSTPDGAMGAAANSNTAHLSTARVEGAKTGNSRIGLAGFRNDPNGMVVMVDVGGLAPGNYLVGIGDPSLVNMLANRKGTTPNRNQRTLGNRKNDIQSTAPPAAPDDAGQFSANGTEQPIAGQRGSTRPAAPQSSALAREPLVPPTPSSQVVADDIQSPAAQASTTTPPPPTVPATGQARPSTIPATGKTNPTSTLPNGQSSANNALTEQMNRTNAAKTGVSATDITQHVGTLTVDQSGTGRLQQVLEGVQVQNVVGQALVIVAQPAGSTTTLPPNLDSTIESNIAPQSTNAGNEPTANQYVKAAAGAANGVGSGPVAAGIIRLLSDRAPPPTQPPAGNDRNAANQLPGTEPPSHPGAIR